MCPVGAARCDALVDLNRYAPGSIAGLIKQILQVGLGRVLPGFAIDMYTHSGMVGALVRQCAFGGIAMGMLHTLTLTSSVRDQGNADSIWTRVVAIMKKSLEAFAAEVKIRLPMGLKTTAQ